MAIRSRLTAQRSGIAFAALLVTSMSVHDRHVAAALHDGLSDTTATTADTSQPAHLSTVSFGTVGGGIIHHYP